MLTVDKVIKEFIDDKLYIKIYQEPDGVVFSDHYEKKYFLEKVCPLAFTFKDSEKPTKEEINDGFHKARITLNGYALFHKKSLEGIFKFLYEETEKNTNGKLLAMHSHYEPDQKGLKNITKELALSIAYIDTKIEAKELKDDPSLAENLIAKEETKKALHVSFTRYDKQPIPDEITQRQELPDYIFISNFVFFCYRAIRDYLLVKYAGDSKLLSVIKTPVNVLNVLLTDKAKTLEKLDKSITKMTNALELVTDAKKKIQLRKQLTEAKKVFEKCVNNFPDNFNFSVYEHYAIFGGFKLLTRNSYKPTEMFFTDILETLNFNKINKSEIGKIKKAFIKLTTQKFPCYMIREQSGKENLYDFYDGDEPIFKLREFGTLDLNIDLTDKEIVKKRLILSLENPALIYDLQNFYTLINGNILKELRDYTKVNEADLYFVEYLVKESHFKKVHTKTDLVKLCGIMKKIDFINSDDDGNGILKDRDSKRRIKEKISKLSDFMVNQKILASYVIDESGEVVFNYVNADREETHIRLPVAESIG